MVVFDLLYLDYDETCVECRYDTKGMQLKASKLQILLKDKYEIKSYISTKVSNVTPGEHVSINFSCEDKLIKKVFKDCKKTKPFSIRTKWKLEESD